jgi:hypothetical protein
VLSEENRVVGPPSEVLNCFGAMEFRIQWLEVKSPFLRVGVFNGWVQLLAGVDYLVYHLEPWAAQPGLSIGLSGAMNLAFEKRGVRLARREHRLFSQEGGITCE